MKNYIRILYCVAFLLSTLVFCQTTGAVISATPRDTYDFAGIPGPYNFYRYQMLATGEMIGVGGDGDFSYIVEMNEYRRRVAGVDLEAVYFVNAEEGWVVGSKGSIYWTEDRGRTWTRESSGVKSDLLAIACVESGRCWITGDDGVILTTLGGGDWTKLKSPVKVSLPAVDFLDDKVGLAVGKNLILKTIDGGASWKKQVITGGERTCNGLPFSHAVHLTGVTIFDATTAWVAAVDGIARYSSATGQWEGMCLREVGPLAGIVSQDGQAVYGIGSDGKNVISGDSGRTWNALHRKP